MDKKYLTVKEFAEAAGVSNKAIYQQISGRLKNYCKIIDNVKMIDSEALKIFYSSEDRQENQENIEVFKCSSQVNSSLECEEVEQNEEQGGKQGNTRAFKCSSQVKSSLENGEVEALKMLISELQKDKEYLKQEAMKWQQLLIDERSKVKQLEAALLPTKEEEVVEAGAAEPQEQAELQLPRTFKEKLKWLFNGK